MPNPNHDDHGRFSSGEGGDARYQELRGKGYSHAGASDLIERGLYSPGLKPLSGAAGSGLNSHQETHQELHDKTVAQPLLNASSLTGGIARALATMALDPKADAETRRVHTALRQKFGMNPNLNERG